MNDRNSNNLRIGLALGSGSSRGLSHIGIINALSEIGIKPEIICGCSVGALVGASYAAENLGELESWASSLTRFEVARFFELNFSFKGFVNTERLHAFLQKHICNENTKIESLTKTFATVSTDLETGREIWFTKGSVIDSVWASISLPGIFPPIRNQGRWMVDGGLVNPVPVSVCRELGADIVIAVNLNGDIVGKHFGNKQITKTEGNIIGTFKNTVKEYSSSLFPGLKSNNNTPGLLDAIAGSINITQDRITRGRMASNPPDILLTPKLSHISPLEFYRAKEIIQEGKECVIRMLPEMRCIMGID